MVPTFSGRLDRTAVLRAVDAVVDLVSSSEVAAAWAGGSALPGMSVGGLTRHLVSQPECAVEFLGVLVPHGRPVLSLTDYAERLDWLDAGVDQPENTSIRDDFNEMAAPGHAASVAILDRARTELPAALAAAAPTVFVPWQDCALDLDDFLVVRLLEIVVHADDLAASIGRETPRFDDDVMAPVTTLLAALSLRRHGQDALLRALARSERAFTTVSAFGPQDPS